MRLLTPRNHRLLHLWWALTKLSVLVVFSAYVGTYVIEQNASGYHADPLSSLWRWCALATGLGVGFLIVREHTLPYSDS